MTTKIIKFGNKKAQLVISNNMKNYFRIGVQNTCAMDIKDRNYTFLNEQTLYLLKKNKYKVCLSTFGQKYMLFITKYDGHNYAIFINKKKMDYIIIDFNFSEELYDGTLLEGELIKNNDNKWVFSITDLLGFKGINMRDLALNARQQILDDILKNHFHPDINGDVCQLIKKEYFDLKYIEDLSTRYRNEIDIKCAGLYFNPEEHNLQGILYIFPEHRTDIKQNKKILMPQNIQQSLSNHMQSNHMQYQNRQSVSNMDNIISNKKQFKNFSIKITSKPDIYILFDGNKKIGYAAVPSINTSRFLREIFKNSDIEMPIVKCEYNKLFNKWVPIHKV